MKKILTLLTNRFFLIALAVVLQIGVIAVIIDRIGSFNPFISIGLTILSIFIMLYIINREQQVEYKLAWIIPILLFPIPGGILYLICSNRRPVRRMRDMLNLQKSKIKPFISQNQQIKKEIEADPDLYGQVNYLLNWADFPVYNNTEITYYKCGEDIFPVVLERIKNAKKFIFMEYFIINPGYMLDTVIDILEKKAAEGVDVRFMYDDIGSIFYTSPNFPKMLEEKGIRCLPFNRLTPFTSILCNNRDHRKICVVDGEVGFTGGFNLSDEYINKASRFGYWKDSGVMLTGEAVASLSAMFLTSWSALYHGKKKEAELKATDDLDDMSVFFPPVPVKQETCYVQPYGDSPLDNENVSESVFLNLINSSKKYLYITTPYLIPDSTISFALKLAAKRGVDVRIITPGIPDKKLAFHLTQSNYRELINAGIKIYQFTPGFIHAKNIVCDDKYAIVGTVNFDFRSLFLHFECGVLFNVPSAVESVKNDIMETMARSELQTKEMTARHLPVRLIQACLRVFAPLF